MKTIEDEYQLGGWLEGEREGGLASQRGASFSYADAATATVSRASVYARLEVITHTQSTFEPHRVGDFGAREGAILTQPSAKIIGEPPHHHISKGENPL